ADVARLLDGGPDEAGLEARRHGDVHYLDVGVGEEVVGVDVDVRDAVQPGDFAGVLGVARGDGDGVEAGLPVGDEVTVAHDEAGAEAADAEVAAARQAGKMFQGRVGRHHLLRRSQGFSLRPGCTSKVSSVFSFLENLSGSSS